jgi:O-antigen/teichoic acid export membrane protein
MYFVFLKNTGKVASGAVLSQVLPIISQILLVRMLVPESFGQFAGWMAFVSVLAVVVTLRLEHSLVLEETYVQRQRVLLAIRLTTILISICTILIYFSVESLIGWSFDFGSVGLICGVLSAICMADNKVMLSFYSSSEKYRKLNYQRLAFAFSTSCGQLVLCYYNPGAESLYWGYTVGGLVCLVFAYNQTKLPFDSLFRTKQMLVRLWTQRKRFIIYSLPADTISTVSGQLPIILVIFMYGDAIGGYLALVLRMVGAPLGLVSLAILDVFKGNAVRVRVEDASYSKLYARTFGILVAVCSLYVMLSYGVAGYLFELIFGKEWATAGIIAAVMTPLFASRFVASPLSYMVYLTQNQQVDLIWQFVMLLVVCLTLTIPSSFELALSFYVFGVSVMYGFYLILSYLMANREGEL